MQRSPSRRTLLRSTALASLLGLAGCTSTQAQPAATTDDSHTTTESAPEPSLNEWLATANDPHTPQVRDFRLQEPPRVFLGVSNPLSFAPPAVKIEPGTTVTWEWTGQGGPHNVVATDGEFDSGDPVAEDGTTFRHTFEEAGTYTYVCEPHEENGMKGAVVVEPAPTSEYPAVDEWLLGVDGYDGTVVDHTGADTATVTAGAEGNRGHFAFDPVAAKVTTGTTVRWKWTGEGGAHTVSFEDAEFGLDDPASEAGVHFEHTFEETGVYRYACAPHHALGGKGALVVVE